MGFVMDALGLSPPKVDIPTPVQTQAAATPVTAAQVDEGAKTAEKEFYQKQALLAAKNALVKTNNLGIAGGPLQTKKTLLGG